MEMNKIVDLNVIKEFKSGNEDAFNEIYSIYYKKIFFIALEYFHDEDRAMDIVQDVFFKVFKNIENLQNCEAFHMWLMRITYNCCNESFRKRRKDVDFFKNDRSDFDENAVYTAYTIDYIQKIEYKDIEVIIRNVLDSMKESNRIVGYLNFFEGLSYQEISNILNVPVGTIKSRISRIKVIVRKKLEEEKYSLKEIDSFPRLINRKVGGNIKNNYIFSRCFLC